MKFTPNNGITAHFDFQWYYTSIPAGVDFSVSMSGDFITLKACGFGCLERHCFDCYGNGALTVQKKDVPKKLLKRIEKEAGG